MAHQDIQGWPLGLRPLNARMRNLDFSVGSISFNTLLTASPTTSSISSSDLDTESTGSFFHDKSKSLGSLIGVSSIWEMPRRGRTTESHGLRDNKKMNLKPKPWLFSLCSKLTTDVVIATNRTNTSSNTPSLGHFLEVERRAVSTTATVQRTDHTPNDYSPINTMFSSSNSLFVDGLVAPRPPPASGVASNGIKSNTVLLKDGNVRFLFPSLCGQLIK